MNPAFGGMGGPGHQGGPPQHFGQHGGQQQGGPPQVCLGFIDCDCRSTCSKHVIFQGGGPPGGQGGQGGRPNVIEGVQRLLQIFKNDPERQGGGSPAGGQGWACTL